MLIVSDQAAPERGTPAVSDDSQNRRITLGAWSADWLESKRASRQPNTVRLYAFALQVVVGLIGADLALDAITRLHIRDAAAQLSKRYAPSTVRLWLNILNTCLMEAVEVGLLAMSPAARPGALLLRKGVRACYVPTWVEVQRWVRALEAEGPLYAALGTLVARTGLRIGEALGLQWIDIDWEHDVITVRRSGPKSNRTKTGRNRTVPMSPHARAALRGLLSGDPVWVFVGPRKRLPLRQGSIHHVLERARVRGGLPKGMTPHRVRHGVGTELIVRGEPLPVVQALLGHTDPAMTLFYAKTAGLRRAAKVASLDD